MNLGDYAAYLSFFNDYSRQNSQALRIIPQPLVWRWWVIFMTHYLVGFAECWFVCSRRSWCPKAKLRLLSDSSSCFGNSAAAGCGYFRGRTQSTMSVLKKPRTIKSYVEGTKFAPCVRARTSKPGRERMEGLQIPGSLDCLYSSQPIRRRR